MNPPLKILHVEDSWEDSELVQNLLQEAGFACRIHRVETQPELIQALEESDFDLILSDCTLPQFHGLQALEITHALKPDLPFIFVSGTIGEEIAIKSLHNGATDYVLKQRLSRLIPAVRRALSESNERARRREMEERLHQARRLEAIGTLAGGLVHDFNNLLQIIKMNAAMLPLKADDPQTVISISENLIKVADRGAHIMGELSAFSRQTATHLTVLDPAKAIKQTLEMLRPALPSNIELVLPAEEKLPAILADASHLDRILTNLIVNAKDAMPQGGPIRVTTGLVQFEPVSPGCSLVANRLYLRVTVADRGTGMNEAARRRAFEPFFTTKASGKGTGLGLAVVFGLMQVHNGFIDLTSELGVGTTIALFFPLAEGVSVDSQQVEKIPPVQLLGSTCSITAD